tara:strand:+ start:567 stop:782 length:216 start_codon:yes stop_codon:yes gene_type:complete
LIEEMVNQARLPSIEEEREKEEQVNLRQRVVAILYREFGNRDDIYECADEWVQKQVTSNGIVSYYKAYYNK